MKCASYFLGLVMLTCSAAVTLSPCGRDNTLEVVENTASNQFTCTGFMASDTAVWRVLIPTDNDIASCRAPSGNSGSNTCINAINPPFVASRTASDRTSLTVDSTDETTYGFVFKGNTLVCRTNTQTNDQGDQCRMDLVAIPGSRTCDVRYNTDTVSSWTLTANCTVSGAYSFLNRYNCQLVQTSPSSFDLGSVVDMAVTPNGKYKTGTCDVTVPLPDTSATYSYKMVVTPGRVDVPAGFETGSSFQIRRPSSPPTHTCDEYVGETQGLSCRCSTTDLGQPAGVIRWTSSGTSQLLLSNVNRSQDGQQLTCEVMWNGQRVQSVVYTLRVASPPSSPVISPPSTDYPFIATVTLGATLTCLSSTPGRPAANYSWPIKQGGRGGTDAQGRSVLTFNTVNKDLDGKTVSCRASNRYTDNRHRVEDGTLTVEVYYLPEVRLDPVTDTNPNQCDIMTSDPLQCLVAEGQKVHFRCGASSKPAPASIMWQGRGQGSDLYLESVNRAQHMSTYTCSVETGPGNHGNDPRLPLRGWKAVTLLVKLSPYSVTLTMNSQPGILSVYENKSVDVDFVCTASGVPTPNLLLTNDQNRELARLKGGIVDVSTSESRLTYTLSTVRCEDSAVYTCTAENGIGQSASSSATLRVLCKMRVLASSFSSVKDGLPVVRLENQQGELRFQILSTDTPLTASFVQLRSNSTSSDRPPRVGLLSVDCTQAPVVYRSDCIITASNVTDDDVGYYNVSLATSTETITFTFGILAEDEEQIRTETPVESDRNKNTSTDGPGLGAGIGIGMAVLFALFLVLVAWLWRRRWKLPCTDVHSPEGTTNIATYIASPELDLPLDTIDSSGPYDELKQSEIGLRSHYEEVSHPTSRCRAANQPDETAEMDSGNEIPAPRSRKTSSQEKTYENA